MLTVKQLQDMLKLYPDNAEVFYTDDDPDWTELVITVKPDAENSLPTIATITLERAPTEIRDLI